MNYVTKIDESKLIKQSNRLIESKYSLTTYEQRMMIAICSQLNSNADNFSTVRVAVADMARFCNFEESKAYSLVKTTLLKLMTRTVEVLQPDGKWYATHWLQSAKYLGDGIIEYCVDEKLKPELLMLKEAYLSTSAAALMEFDTEYSMRIYMLLKKMLRVGNFEYKIDFFKERFQLGKAYDLFANLKNRILDPAINEINEKSDIVVSHSYIKEGRAYTKIRFNVKMKQDVLDKPKEIREIPLPPEEEAPRELLIGQLAYYEISPSIAVKIIGKYGLERVETNLKYARSKMRGQIANKAGWIIDCIENDRAADDEKRKKLAAAERERRKQKEKERMDSIIKPYVSAKGSPPPLEFYSLKDELEKKIRDGKI